MTSATELKRLIGLRKAIAVPGTANALFARVIQDLGYEIVYVTGAGVANMSLGVPDIGLTTVTEETVAATTMDKISCSRDVKDFEALQKHCSEVIVERGSQLSIKSRSCF